MDLSTPFYYDSRGCGEGKTFEQLTRIIEQTGLYLFAVDRLEIIDERRTQIDAMASQAGVSLHAVVIHNAAIDRATGGRSVRVAIEALPSTYDSGHVCAFITHEGLKSADLRRFSDWHLVIDEAPSLFDRCNLVSSISGPLVRELFHIEAGPDLNRIVPRQKIGRRDIYLDTLAAPVATLHARAGNPRNMVVTHLQSWDDLVEDGRWSWWSLWSPCQLAAFASVTILAAAFDRSLTFALCQSIAPEIRWQPIVSTVSSRPYRTRKLIIRYFAEAHEATRHRFDTEAGRSALAKIAHHVSMRPMARIWTCNLPEQKDLSRRMGRGYLTPKQAGSNAWSHIDEACILYTAKPCTHERKILAAFEVDVDAVIETRERDTLYQFVARTSLRDPDSSRPVTVFVYDRVQAEALARSFAVRSEIEISLELVDLGFAHDVVGKAAFARLTPEEKKLRKRIQARDRKRKQRTKDAESGSVVWT